MRKYLLPEKGSFYKVNLHCHTTVSDGRLTPAQVKDLYVRHGYSAIAFTDHNMQVTHPELKDDRFIPLIGVEYNVNQPGYPGKQFKTCHFCLVSLEEDAPNPPCFSEEYINKKYVNNLFMADYDPDCIRFVREYTPECVNTMIKAARDAGYFVTYNHPSWSRENFGDYMKYEGMNAMEIANNSCLSMGYNDYNDRVYDDMLRGGKRIFCIATDDNHNKHPEGDPECDSLGGWTVIKAEKLEYRALTFALEKGNFYASTGPEIRELWYEDGVLHVGCSEAVRVNVIYGIRAAQCALIRDGVPVTAADFKLRDEFDWVRVDVIDAQGKHANSNAFFFDQLH